MDGNPTNRPGSWSSLPTSPFLDNARVADKPRTAHKTRLLNLSHPMMRYHDADDAQEFLGQSVYESCSVFEAILRRNAVALSNVVQPSLPDFDNQVRAEARILCCESEVVRCNWN
jgi:hypothetical protein